VFVQTTYETISFLGFNAAAELPPFCGEVPEKKVPGNRVGSSVSWGFGKGTGNSVSLRDTDTTGYRGRYFDAGIVSGAREEISRMGMAATGYFFAL